MKWNAFLDQLADWFSRHELLEPELRWVVGVSGGPDSTLLLHALKTVSERCRLSWALHVAHLHHGLRGADADNDADFVAALAESLALPALTERVDTQARAAEHGGSLEEVARQQRYDFLERTALKTGCDLVAVGHHADDDVETILHRICRGTGLRGLAGIPAVRAIQPGSRVRLVRPLLRCHRETIEQLCAECGFQTRRDATNETDEFTRGNIRNVVLPFLRKTLNPNVSEALLRLAEQARWLGTYLEDTAERTFDSLLIESAAGRLALSTPNLLSKHQIIQAEVVRRAVTLVLSREQDLGFAHIQATLQLAANPDSGKELHLPGSVVVRKQYNRLEFNGPDRTAAEDLPELMPVAVACPGQTPLPALRAELAAEICDVDGTKIEELRRSHPVHEEWLDLDYVRLPLLVRGRRSGDRFHPLGAPGHKSLNDFLSDEKVDPQMRARLGVLCDQAGPIWIMPLRIDERVKLRPTTRRAIHLTLGQPAHPPS
ncbi:MAG: tRNA lysidine(34) synthetase TilS, partial [Planctomycetes bacterium]|nr:tRNA lysidine(34) synthetase TilS [Planctomycetota bacterium]